MDESLIGRLRAVANGDVKYDKGGDLLDEAADEIERLRAILDRVVNASQPILYRAEDWFADLNGEISEDEEFIALHSAIIDALSILKREE